MACRGYSNNTNYFDFVKQRLNPLQDELVRQDRRLCRTLASNGYTYQTQDEKSENWVLSQEC